MTTNKGGRPRSIKTEDELIEKFTKYIQDCISLEKPKTPTKRHFLAVSGLYVDLISEYNKNYKDEFSRAVKYIDNVCEAYLEFDVINNEANYGAAKFSLINNYGWKDYKAEDNNSGNTYIIQGGSEEMIKKIEKK